jgi:hypothetical protein
MGRWWRDLSDRNRITVATGNPNGLRPGDAHVDP